MCYPALIALIPAIAGASSQSSAASANKSIGKFNAGVATMQANDALARGDVEETKYRESVRHLIGAQRAGFAGQGVVLSDGSALDVQMDTARIGELDALTIRNNAAREAWGFKVQAANAKLGGAYAYQAGKSQAAGTLIGGLANAYSANMKAPDNQQVF